MKLLGIAAYLAAGLMIWQGSTGMAVLCAIAGTLAITSTCVEDKR